ncbi:MULTISPECIES: hypothetical protein [unclassified Pseudomonas]|uniref:hypothetical protein n=1 Tax=unclassified Pseudomonas TaxID=196821 RepID=UPI0025D82FA3|nr:MULTISPECIES: hypothetical protein [unclassified Pseudomonas]
MLHSYEIHYLLGMTKHIVRVSAPHMNTHLAWKISIIAAGACAGAVLPLLPLSTTIEVAARWQVSNTRWNKAVLFHTRREVGRQQRQLACVYPVDDAARSSCNRIVCNNSTAHCGGVRELADLETS